MYIVLLNYIRILENMVEITINYFNEFVELCKTDNFVWNNSL